jgi:serine-type D-Ala-D-Ala carboxypeptidase/endopeptidase (penicillin-binding protein 4)
VIVHNGRVRRRWWIVAGSLAAVVAAAAGIRTVQPGTEAAAAGDAISSTSEPSTTAAVPTTIAETTTTTAPIPVHARLDLDDLWSRTPGSACLVVGDKQQVLYEQSADRSLVPASTTKLLTAAAVLDRLGPNARLQTQVVAASAAGGIVEGDLWLVGGGDPVLGTDAYAGHFERQPVVATRLETLADEVVRAGVIEVRGRVMGDDSRYDAERKVPSWPDRYVDDNQTGPLSALSVNDGFVSWARDDTDNVRFADPATGGAEVFTALLRERGVTVVGDAGAGRRPDAVVGIASIVSPTVGELVGEMLRESDNGTAELLVKELGLVERGIGSTAAGAEALLARLQHMGLPTNGLTLVDGSGLDPRNQLTCRVLFDVLRRAPEGGAIASGLAVAGRSGTLWKRLLDTPAAGNLRGKTGSISAVVALAGSISAADAHGLHFAYVVNGAAGAPVRQLQDELAITLATYDP